MMEFFLSGSLPLIDFVICDVMTDMANKLLSLSLSLSLCKSLKRFVVFHRLPFAVIVGNGDTKDIKEPWSGL